MLLFEYCKHIQGQLHSQTQIFYSKLLKKISAADVCVNSRCCIHCAKVSCLLFPSQGSPAPDIIKRTTEFMIHYAEPSCCETVWDCLDQRFLELTSKEEVRHESVARAPFPVLIPML